MADSLRRLSLILMFITLVPGLVVGLGGLWAIWRMEGRVASALENTADLTLRALTTTEKALDAAASSLDEAQDNFTLIRGSVDEISDALLTTVSVTGQIGDLVGGELTAILADTRSSLEVVQSSARLIDDTLAVVTMLPFIGSRYAPEMPLEKSIGKVAASLDGIPASLIEVQNELQATSQSLSALQADIDQLGGELGNVEKDLETARQAVTEYQRILDEVIQRLTRIRPAIAGWVRAVAIGLSVLCVWVLLMQIALLLQALANSPRRTAPEVSPAPQTPA